MLLIVVCNEIAKIFLPEINRYNLSIRTDPSVCPSTSVIVGGFSAFYQFASKTRIESKYRSQNKYYVHFTGI